MSRGKPGMGKYQGFRGPHPGETAAHLKFWLEDLADNCRMLAEAKAAGDTRVVNVMHRQRKEIMVELGRHAKQVAA